MAIENDSLIIQHGNLQNIPILKDAALAITEDYNTSDAKLWFGTAGGVNVSLLTTNDEQNLQNEIDNATNLATQAVATSNDADSNSTNALTTSTQAKNISILALNTASQAEANSTIAINTADAANAISTIANNNSTTALETAENIDAKASAAEIIAENALNRANNIAMNNPTGLKDQELIDIRHDNVNDVDYITAGARIDNLSDYILDNATFQNAGGTATAITLKTELMTNGYSYTFIASYNNYASATTINGKPFYKPNTTTAPTLIAGKGYTVWYNLSKNCFFIKASPTGTATTAQVLAGVSYSNEDDTDLIGIMIDRTNSGTTIMPSTYNQAFPQGYYGGSTNDGMVYGDSGLIPDNILLGATIFGVTGTGAGTGTGGGGGITIVGKRFTSYVITLPTDNFPISFVVTNLAFTPSMIFLVGSMTIFANGAWYGSNTNTVLTNLTSNTVNSGAGFANWIVSSTMSGSSCTITISSNVTSHTGGNPTLYLFE